MSAIIDSPASNPRLTREEAAEYVGASAATLATWATRGSGPPFLKVGAKVLYLQRDLDDWLSSRRIRCTAELGVSEEHGRHCLEASALDAGNEEAAQ